MSWCVWLLPYPLTTDHIWIKGKKNQVTGLTKLRAVYRLRTWPSLSFYQKQPCPSLSVVHIDPILPFCHSLGPSYAALKFANPEYITVSGGKPLPFFHIHDSESFPCFLVLHHKTMVQFNFLAKLQRETKKSNLLKVMQSLRLSLLPFLALNWSWIITREGAVKQILSNTSLSDYKKFKWKITLKERRLFLLI